MIKVTLATSLILGVLIFGGNGVVDTGDVNPLTASNVLGDNFSFLDKSVTSLFE